MKFQYRLLHASIFSRFSVKLFIFKLETRFGATYNLINCYNVLFEVSQIRHLVVCKQAGVRLAEQS
jgi:hypothetical protein